MPSVEENLNEGLQSGIDSDGHMWLSRTFFCKDLDNPFPDAGEHYRLLSAYTLPGIPRHGSTIIVGPRRLVAKGFSLDPWPPADATLKVTYNEDVLGPVPSVIVESGSTYEQAETDFLASEMRKPFAQRKPIVVTYSPKRAIDGQGKGTGTTPQSIRLPVMVGKAFRRYTVPFLGFDPGELAEKFVSRTNMRPWRPYGARIPYRPEEVMCVSIVGRNSGQGWEGIFDFVIDKVTRFHQVGRWVNKENGQYPELDARDLASSNGIVDAVVQLDADFNLLPIPK